MCEPAGGRPLPAGIRAINPKSTIPTLVRRDGTALTEVPAIAYWLGRTHPRAGLWPQDVEVETRLLETMAYMTATIHGQGFARLFATSTFTRNAADHPAVKALGEEIVRKGFGVLAQALGEGPYLAGGFSVADPILFYLEFWADKLGLACRPPLPRTTHACWTARWCGGFWRKRATLRRSSAKSRLPTRWSPHDASRMGLADA